MWRDIDAITESGKGRRMMVLSCIVAAMQKGRFPRSGTELV
jgi:hypothetical protein